MKKINNKRTLQTLTLFLSVFLLISCNKVEIIEGNSEGSFRSFISAIFDLFVYWVGGFAIIYSFIRGVDALIMRNFEDVKDSLAGCIGLSFILAIISIAFLESTDSSQNFAIYFKAIYISPFSFANKVYSISLFALPTLVVAILIVMVIYLIFAKTPKDKAKAIKKKKDILEQKKAILKITDVAVLKFLVPQMKKIIGGQFFELPNNNADKTKARCSDNECPCLETEYNQGEGYLYIPDYGNPIFMCKKGAELRGIDLDDASLNAKLWWAKGIAQIPNSKNDLPDSNSNKLSTPKLSVFSLKEATSIDKFNIDKKNVYLKLLKLETEIVKGNYEPDFDTYFLTAKKDSTASYSNLIVKTGSYNERTKYGLKLADYRRQVFVEVFSQPGDSYSDFFGTISQVSNFAPPGYEITDYSEYNSLLAEIEAGNYTVKKIGK